MWQIAIILYFECLLKVHGIFVAIAGVMHVFLAIASDFIPRVAVAFLIFLALSFLTHIDPTNDKLWG